MARRTSSQAGLWSASSTWGGSAAPGVGDTAAYNHSITVDGSVIVGTSPQINVAGTGTVGTGGSSSATLTGSGTAFLTQLSVGDIVTIGANIRIVTAIANDTSLTMAAVATITNGTSFTFTTCALFASGSGSRLIVNNPLEIRGAFTQNMTIGSKTDCTTIAAGQGIEFNASNATSPASQKYPWMLLGANSQLHRVVFSGTSGSHCYLRSNSGGGNAYLTYGNAINGGWLNTTYTDFTRVGDATNPLCPIYLSNTGSAELTIDHCVFTACGVISGLTTANSAATLSVTNSSWNTSTGTQNLSFPQGPTASTLTGNVFDKPVNFAAYNGFTITGNVFQASLSGGSGTPWTTFSNNWVCIQDATNGKNFNGDTLDSVFYFNDSASINAHCIGLNSATNASTINWLRNVFYFNGSTSAGETMFCNTNPSVVCTLNVKFNIILPNPSGSTTGGLFSSNGDLTNLRAFVEHNTHCMEGQDGMEVGHGQTIVESPKRYQSVRANLFFATNPNTAKIDNIDGTTLLDIIDPANADYNAAYKFRTTSGNVNFTNEGRGYWSKFTSTPGVNDISLDGSGGPSFVNPSANLASWDTSLGGPGTEVNAQAQVVAKTAGYTAAAFLAYIRAAYRPKNFLLNNATYPGDTATTDAAGNPLGGAIGAMAWTPSGSFNISTPYLKPNYYNLLDRG